MPNLLQDDDFTVWVPNVVEFDFSKSLEESEGAQQSAPGYLLQGYASTPARDRQDEIVVQKGLDFSEFIQHGWYNDNHKQGTTDAVGYPILAELHEGRGWFTKGYLLKGYPPAERIVMLAKSLQSTPRRLGFSIEGKVLERGMDNRIVRAKVRNVAVTNCPVNTECTWDLVSKAFASASEIEDRFEKALEAGGSNPGQVGGAALRARSVEADESSEEDAKVLVSHVRKGLNLTMEEAVRFLRKIRPQYSEETCRRIANFARQF